MFVPLFFLRAGLALGLKMGAAMPKRGYNTGAHGWAEVVELVDTRS